jgi:hypothetical protein
MHIKLESPFRRSIGSRLLFFFSRGSEHTVFLSDGGGGGVWVFAFGASFVGQSRWEGYIVISNPRGHQTVVKRNLCSS